jgi:hypothetical protein
MDDARAGAPEADAVARRCRAQEVEHLAIRDVRGGHVLGRALMRLNQVITVNRARHRGLVATRRDELQDRHLRRRVLHRNAIGIQLEVRLARVEILLLRMREMPEQHLLRVGEWATEPLADDREVAFDGLVRAANQIRCRLDGRHAFSSRNRRQASSEFGWPRGRIERGINVAAGIMPMREARSAARIAAMQSETRAG